MVINPSVRYAFGLLRLLVLGLFFVGQLAAEAVPLPQGEDPLVLGKYFQILEDPTESLSVSAVSAMPTSSFKTVNEEVPNFGFKRGVIWLRLEIGNSPPEKPRDMEFAWDERQADLYFLEVATAHIDDVRFFIPNGTGFQEMKAGRAMNAGEKLIPHENMLFPISMQKHTGAEFNRTFYLRVKQEGTLQIPIYIWKHDSFDRFDRIRYFVIGGYYGLVLVMLVYNLFLWLTIRDKAYTYYVLTILFTHGLVMFHQNGFTYSYLVPNNPWVAKKLNLFFLNSAVFFSVQFLRTLLDTPLRTPRLDRLLLFSLPIPVALILLTPLTNYFLVYRATIYLIFAATILIVVTASNCVRRGDRVAVFYLLAWGGLVSAAIGTSLRALGLAPLNFFTQYGLQIGASLEVVLLSFALGSRINEIRKQNEKVITQLHLHEKSRQLAEALRQLTAKISFTLDEIELEKNVRTWLFEVVPFDEIHLIEYKGKLNRIGEGKIPLSDEEVVALINASHLVNIRKDDSYWIGIPIPARDRTGGLILLGRPSFFTDGEIEILRTVAAEVGLAIENIRLFVEVHQMATIDSVTSLFTRPHFMQLAGLELQRVRRYKRPLSAMMLDIDFFKEVNDTYGHAAGDDVLGRVAAICRKSLREVDLIGRYGGDEFCILLPETTLDSAQEVGERIRSTVEKESILFEGKGKIHVTVSLGVAEYSPEVKDLDDLLSIADRGLLSSKKSGRNRITSS